MAEAKVMVVELRDPLFGGLFLQYQAWLAGCSEFARVVSFSHAYGDGEWTGIVTYEYREEVEISESESDSDLDMQFLTPLSAHARHVAGKYGIPMRLFGAIGRRGITIRQACQMSYSELVGVNNLGSPGATFFMKLGRDLGLRQD
jgi:hypothetical protein